MLAAGVAPARTYRSECRPVANFLVCIADAAVPLGEIFEGAVAVNEGLKRQTLLVSKRAPGLECAIFARRNGSGGELVGGPANGFVLITGTWLHPDGYGSGRAQQLLERFLAVGAARLARELEGFFFLLASNGDGNIFAITDLVGSHHAFMRELDSGIVLSGSSAVLAALAPYTLDEIGCQEFVRTGIIYEQRTLYNEVRKLPPATVFHFRGGRLVGEHRFWDPRALAEQPLSLTEAADQLYEVGKNTVRRIAELYPRRLCDLTGGYDSRALGALLLGAGVEFDTTVSGPDDSADVKISHGLAKIAGLKHSQRQRSAELTDEDLERAFQLCDGEYDLHEYARIMRTHDAHSQHYDVTLNGSFGEVARGYWWELLTPNIGKREPLHSEKIARKRYAAAAKGAELFMAEKRLNLDQHFAAILDRNNRGFETLPNTLQLDYSYLNLRMQRWQGRIASSTDQIWPCVSPFMFRSILEIMLRAEPRARHRSLLVRAMLARHYPKWAAYPLEHGYPAEPFGLRNAWRFAPLLKFYATKISERVQRIAGLGNARGSGSPAPFSFADNPQLAELLSPPSMLSGTLYAEWPARPESLDQALRDPMTRTRALSLELALRSVRAAKSAD